MSGQDGFASRLRYISELARCRTRLTVLSMFANCNHRNMPVVYIIGVFPEMTAGLIGDGMGEGQCTPEKNKLVSRLSA